MIRPSTNNGRFLSLQKDEQIIYPDEIEGLNTTRKSRSLSECSNSPEIPDPLISMSDSMYFRTLK